MSWIQVLVIGYLVAFCHGSDDDSPILRSIEGKVEVEGLGTAEALTTNSAVVVDGGRYIGFLKHSGEFEIVDVPPGTYLVEVISPNYVFDPVRVDISAKSGKIRARKVDLLKMSSVSHLPYPLRFKSSKPAQFFEKREQWNIVDTLKNPTVLLLVLPLGLAFLMPKLMKNMDPDTQKEVQESMSTFQQQGAGMPSLEEMFTNWFGGGSASQKIQTKKPKQAVKKPKRT